MVTPTEKTTQQTQPPRIQTDPVPVKQNKTTFKDIMKKIWNVASLIFQVAAAAVLFYFNPSLFAISFAIGVVWSDKAQNVIDRVHAVIKKQKLLGGAIAIAGALISLPVTLACGSIYAGLRLGCAFADGAHLKQQPPEQTAAASAA